MPITFDTLDELKAFYRTFKLEEKAGGTATKSSSRTAKKAVTTTDETAAPKKRGRKPGSKTTVKTTRKTADKTPAKRAKTTAAKSTVKKAKTTKAKPAGRPKVTLTSKIKDTIQKFLDAKREFTANDIYGDLSKRDKSVNKQSVITSVLKQMNNSFPTVSVTERAGAGPRPVKLYNANKK